MEIRKIIEQNIKAKGYISVDQFMEIAMSKYNNSYYRSHHPIGEDKDFITSPEISQMFGEMIGVWAMDAWYKLGKPAKCNIIEFGSGSGKLLRDFLRMAQMDPAFYNSINVWIIDINQTLIKEQKEILKEHTNVRWVKALNNIPDFPSIIIANEFFDALPIKQYQLNNNIWFEKVITLDDKNNFEFLLKDIDQPLQKKLKAEHPNARNGSVFEESNISQVIMRDIAKYIKINKGYVLIIDYGYDIDPNLRKRSEYISTLQALKNHKYVNIFEDIGNSDITAHVDFGSLNKKAETYNLNRFKTANQQSLLNACGIEIRLKQLQKANSSLEKTLFNQYYRLIAEDQMGKLFKAISISSENKAPLGFEKHKIEVIDEIEFA